MITIVHNMKVYPYVFFETSQTKISHTQFIGPTIVLLECIISNMEWYPPSYILHITSYLREGISQRREERITINYLLQYLNTQIGLLLFKDQQSIGLRTKMKDSLFTNFVLLYWKSHSKQGIYFKVPTLFNFSHSNWNSLFPN